MILRLDPTVNLRKFADNLRLAGLKIETDLDGTSWIRHQKFQQPKCECGAPALTLEFGKPICAKCSQKQREM